MWPSGSSVRSGFSLLEVLVALAAAGILLFGLTRFFKDSSHAYDMQSQIAERNQNAHFSVDFLTEALQESGANLPDTGIALITPSGALPCGSITLGVNPRGGLYFISSASPANLFKVPVADTSSFEEAEYVLVDYLSPARATIKRPISGKKKGAAGALDTLLLSIPLPYQLGIGDIVYAYKEDVLALSGGNLTVDGVVVAENIDSLKFNFYDAARTATTAWSRMRSARIDVTARTARPDPGLSGDGYRRLSLNMTVFLRSRI
jgi:prepilin-type N-terminal cleavage/methylation domain-containing protein